MAVQPSRTGRAANLLVGGALVGLLGLFLVADGGYEETVWQPAGVFALALLAVVVLARPTLVAGLPRATTVALVAFAAFTAWSYASIAWADARGDAWRGANRSLLYLVVYALLALWPWSVRDARAVLGTFSVLVALVGCAAMLSTSRAADPAAAFTDALFVEPAGYHNAAAAVFLLAFWPALLLAARRETPIAGRAVLLATAGVLLSLAIVPQSRGAAIVFPFALALYFVVVPGRVRSLLVLAPVAAATWLGADAMLDVYRSARAGEAATGLEHALSVLALEGAALFALGLAIAFFDSRVSLPARTARVMSRAVGAGAILAAAVAIAVVVPDEPLEHLDARWEEFKGGDRPDPGASLHFTSSIGSNRYDFWRVGLAEFRASPLVGIGTDNFAIPYLKERRSDEEPAYPHSVEVQVLSQLGIVGAVLLTVFFGAAVVSALRASRRGADAAALGAVAVAACGYWGGHASGDWLWEFPVLAAAAVAFLGLGAGLARDPPQAPATLSRGWLAVGGLGALVAAGALALPWLAATETDHAARVWHADADAAYAHLARARALNPLSERADLVEGAIASRRRDWPRMRAAFERALERNDANWYAHFELAVVAAVTGDKAEARLRLARAEQLNPREPALDLLRETLRAGDPVDPDRFDRLFLERLRERIE